MKRAEKVKGAKVFVPLKKIKMEFGD